MILNSLKIVFQNIKIKLNIRTWMTLKSSVVIFQTIEPYQQMWPLQFQQPLKPQWPLQLPFCTIYISTKIFFTDISTFSVSGCWGQRMLLFWTLLDETQMPKPLEAPRHNNSKKKCRFLLLSHLKSYIWIWDSLYVLCSELARGISQFKIATFGRIRGISDFPWHT